MERRRRSRSRARRDVGHRSRSARRSCWPALVVGLAISLVQALTQIQEATLAFVPKVVVIFAVVPAVDAVHAGDADRLHPADSGAASSGLHCRKPLDARAASSGDRSSPLFLVFSRIGSAFTVLPGFAEAFVPTRVRLLLAGATSLVVAPILGADAAARCPRRAGSCSSCCWPARPSSACSSAWWRASPWPRSQVAGMIIGFQTSLANAFAYDPTTAQQDAVRRRVAQDGGARADLRHQPAPPDAARRSSIPTPCSRPARCRRART